MFQTFEASTSPDQGPPRLAALRDAMTAAGLDGYLVPRADAHQGEYVAPRDDRLAWLTGFTGSAGFAAVLAGVAGLFVDGRYRVQVKAQAADVFTPVNWPETKLGDWLAAQCPNGAVIGYDPWLHTLGEIEAAEKRLAGTGIVLRETDNLIDQIWEDQPAPPSGRASAYPDSLAGKTSAAKRAEIADILTAAGQNAAVLTLPDSICWLLNIRSSDIARIPVIHAFAILRADRTLTLFTDPAKLEDLDLGEGVSVAESHEIATSLAALQGPMRVDRSSAPVAITRILAEAEVEIAYAADPCALPKACKTDAELAGTREAHLRDGAAMCDFLAWLDITAPQGGLTEIDVVQKLEGFRRATNALRDVAFETISGSGPNGAIVHYRVTEETNRAVSPGDLLLVDSGGQYLDGTTDITRTIAIGAPTDDQRACFTRVLQGMIAISQARWPKGITGRDLDALARIALWRAGQDYDHGTGHGVGAYLSVHEGPQRISRTSDVALQPGMILSNEPGYYREGAFGIRIENLVVVETAPTLPGGDKAREMYQFETLTWVPIDLALVDADLLSGDERGWLNRYHAEVRAKMEPRVGPETAAWLAHATRAI